MIAIFLFFLATAVSGSSYGCDRVCDVLCCAVFEPSCDCCKCDFVGAETCDRVFGNGTGKCKKSYNRCCCCACCCFCYVCGFCALCLTDPCEGCAKISQYCSDCEDLCCTGSQCKKTGVPQQTDWTAELQVPASQEIRQPDGGITKK
ncbi:MAG: hypothetical protein QG604_556 [Candidatus Dependentiae bacterium]|nr:hypothetical protein [Candidatus Dependentiae bacterium]